MIFKFITLICSSETVCFVVPADDGGVVFPSCEPIFFEGERTTQHLELFA